MKKINNFDEIQENSGFRDLPDGGYIVGIKKVEDIPSESKLRMEVDICRGEYKNYFQKKYDNNKFETKYWDGGGVITKSYGEKALPYFKGFITSVTKSNPNFKWDWDETKLKNKILGVVIASKEKQGKNGKVYVNKYIDSVHSVEAIEKGDFTIPPLKKLEVTQQTTANKSDENIDFTKMFDNNNEPEPAENAVDDDPFNNSEVNPFL